MRRLADYVTDEDTWATRLAGVLRVVPGAYFSAEFGVHESLPLYSGGLGILAGDYLKSASDLGLPMMGVGLFYARGYFHQRLDPNGWQTEAYGLTDIDALPLRRALQTLAWRYNADRMVIDYAMECYLTAAGGRPSSIGPR